MDKIQMVSLDITVGSDVMQALDSAKVKVTVALWAHLSEYSDWRLFLAGREFDGPSSRNAYNRLNEVLAEAGFTPRRIPNIQIMPMTDSFIKDLRRRYAKHKDVEGTRISSQLFGDRFIEDSYVYRIS